MDSSAWKNHGVPGGDSPPTWTTGLEGGGLEFQTSHVKIPHAAHLDFADGPFTMELAFVSSQQQFHNNLSQLFWKRSEDGGDPQVHNQGWTVTMYGGAPQAGGLAFALHDYLQEVSAQDVTGTFNDGIWHPLRAVRHPQSVEIHIEGSAGHSEDSSAIDDIGNDVPITLGNSSEGHPPRWYEGIMDSVRIMSRALEPDEFLHYPLLGWET